MKKATPQLSKVTVDETMYAKGKCRKDLHFEPEKQRQLMMEWKKKFQVHGVWRVQTVFYM